VINKNKGNDWSIKRKHTLILLPRWRMGRGAMIQGASGSKNIETDVMHNVRSCTPLVRFIFARLVCELPVFMCVRGRPLKFF
jgi:hypothetical protein